MRVWFRTIPGETVRERMLPLPLRPDSNDGNGRPRQPAVDAPPQPDEAVEDIQLETAELLSLEQVPRHVPGRTRDAVEVQNALHAETRLLHLLLELFADVAAEGAWRRTGRPKDFGAAGHQDDGSPAGPQRRVDVAQARHLVLD